MLGINGNYVDALAVLFGWTYAIHSKSGVPYPLILNIKDLNAVQKISKFIYADDTAIKTHGLVSHIDNYNQDVLRATCDWASINRLILKTTIILRACILISKPTSTVENFRYFVVQADVELNFNENLTKTENKLNYFAFLNDFFNLRKVLTIDHFVRSYTELIFNQMFKRSWSFRENQLWIN